MTLRSLLGPESGMPDTEAWHQSDRGELSIKVLQPDDTLCGGLEVFIPSGENVRLLFLANGRLHCNAEEGFWQLGADGILELELRTEEKTVCEKIWFSKPNLRLRCTLEQWNDGRPGRASFSSEIRRVSRQPQSTQAGR